ncbi:hypothetical protein ScPMuIL_006133 [Solemya velum]
MEKDVKRFTVDNMSDQKEADSEEGQEQSAACGEDCSVEKLIISDQNDANCEKGQRREKTMKQKEPDPEAHEELLKRKVFVGNISYRMKERELRKHFSKFGEVQHCHLARDHIHKWSRGIGFVTFKTAEGAAKTLAAEDDDLYLDSRLMRVKPAELSKRVTYFQRESDRGAEELASTDETSTVEEDSVLEEPQEVDTVSSRSEGGLHVNDLCDEVLVQIFLRLPLVDRVQITRVCKRWKALSSLIWADQRHLEFKGLFRRFEALTDKILNSILQKCGTYLRSLDVSASPRLLTDFALDIIGKHAKDLEQLDISGVSATNKSIEKLAAHLKKLKVIKLQRCFHLSEKGYWWLLHSCDKLEHIDMQGSSTLTGQCFHMLGPGVKCLRLNNCHKLTDVGIRKIQEKCPCVEEIQVSHCQKLTDSSLGYMQEMKNFRVLHLSGNFPEMSSTGLKTIGRLQLLTELNLSFNDLVNDEVLCCIAGGCISLQCLDIAGCHWSVTDTGVQSLANCCQLHTLNISYLNKVTDVSLELVAIQGRLKKLVARACSELTDSGIVSVSVFCPHLQHLDLSGCLKISNKALENWTGANERHTPNDLVLITGGTSMELELVDLSSASVTIDNQDYSQARLRTDREIILPAEDEFSSGEEGETIADQRDEETEGYDGKVENTNKLNILSEGHAAGAEVDFDDEWDQFEDAEDGFLLGDDPLEAERWNMS